MVYGAFNHAKATSVQRITHPQRHMSLHSPNEDGNNEMKRIKEKKSRLPMSMQSPTQLCTILTERET